MLFKGVKKITILLLFIVYLPLFFVPEAGAGWVDDWFTQATATGPLSFEGQKRGFYTAGGMSARFPHTGDALATVSLPNFKAGCGGIDMFMGGFSFLDMNYLGQKLQNIMTGAPVFAFNIALETLSASLKNNMVELESLADKLNSLQLDDCRASKAVVTVAKDAFTGDWDSAKEEINSLSVDTGFASFYKDSQEKVEADPSASIVATKATVTGGDADLDKLLYQQGSLLEKAAQKFSYSTAWTDLVRGYVGDLYVSAANNPLSITVVTPCLNNLRNDDYTDFVDGVAEFKDNTGACAKITDVKKSITVYVETNMSSIAAKFAATPQVALTAEETNFVNMSPVPVYRHLIMARIGNIDAAFIQTMTGPVAHAYAAKILKDLYEMSGKILDRYYMVMSDKSVEDTALREDALSNIASLRDKITPNVRRLSDVLVSKR
ncbi:MAG: conjugal transfer protein TraH, partial [Thermodesulfobacteriota bacterium]